LLPFIKPTLPLPPAPPPVEVIVLNTEFEPFVAETVGGVKFAVAGPSVPPAPIVTVKLAPGANAVAVLKPPAPPPPA
jgi:hypothetical protein